MKLPPIKHEDLTVSAHGFSLFLAFFVRSTIVAIGWLVVFLVALCVFLWQSYGLFHAYRSYASQFDIHIRYGNVPFPAVSICNLNTFKKSHLGEYPELFALVDAFTGGGGTTSTSVTTTASPPSGRRKRAALPPFPMSGPSPDLYCYFFETFDKKNYANHVAGCQAYGAELPEVPSMDEVNYVNALVDKKTTIKTVGGFYFLGYDDYVTYKTFATKSGTTLATTNYMSGQPNHLSGKQHCIHAVSDKSYQWNDLKCEDTGFGVCQLKVTCTQPSILNGQAVMAENQQQATVSCDVGYYLEGDPQLTCGCDGTWVRLPVCSPALVFGPTSLGKCYHVSTPQPLRTWTDAKDFCSSSPNRALPDFHRNLAGSDDVTSELTEMADVFAAADGALTTATSFAVGYTRTGTTGAFTSVNAYTLGASAGVWDTGNPSAVANTCTYVAKDNGYATLRSQDCGTLSDLNTVCEIPGVGCDVDPAKYSKATYAAGEALSCLNGFSLTNAPTCNCDGTWSGASADLCSDAEFGPGPSGMCYRVAGRGNFDASVALCTALGLDLFELPASIADADHLAEYNFVSSTAASYTPVINDYYTGYRRNNALPGWQYVRSTDNSLMTWMNWNTNPVEPNGGDPCVHCYSGWGYRFNDAPCGAEKYTICSHRVFCEATVADSDWSTGGSTFAGQPASMVCSDSYVLTGNVPICGCDGQWSGALPTCVWCASCPMTVPNSDAAAGISLLSGQKAAITCDAGYITGDDMPTCTCGTLDRTVPVCSVALPKPIIENACTPISCTGALQCNNSVGCCTYGGTEHCLCEIGFTSPDCGQNIDDCWSAPCENGGMCVDGIDTYSCDCAAGYTGKNCEIDIDECASNPCDDGTKCLQGVGTFSCLNMTEYVGLVDAAYAYEPTIGPDGVVVPENDQSLQMRAQDKIAYVVRSLGLDMAGNVSDFLKDCWQGSMTGCEKLFLNQTFDPDLGTCFVYNFNPNDRIHTSNNWADDELHLHMYVQQSEYLPITDSAGVRLLVHSPNTPAFPDAQSFRIAPGYINFLNLVYESSSQLPAPYSDCVDKGHPDPYFYDGAYVVGGCERSRMQQSVVDACDCGDPRLPLPNNASYCDISKATKAGTRRTRRLSGPRTDTLRNHASVVVRYETLLYAEIIERPSYQFVSLLSHFGGWMGVMLGMSLISVLEFIVFGQWIVGLVRDPAVSKKSLTARREHVPKKKSIAAPKKNLKT